MSSFPRFGPPPDPAYVRFVEGLEQHFTNFKNGDPYRWFASETRWITVVPSKSWLAEVDVPDTDPGSTIEHKLDWDTGHYSLKISQVGLPNLFENVQAQNERYKARFSHLVWNPVTGHWRRWLATVSPPPPPSNRCVALLAEVQVLLDRKLITAHEASVRRSEILRVCQ